MKALYVPSAVLALILLFSLWTGLYTEQRTAQWLTGLERTGELVEKESWDDAQSQLLAVHRDWEYYQASFHLFLEHQDLDAAEELFSGAIAACRKQDSAETSIHLEQLCTQLAFLAETQALNIQNIL